MNERVKKLRKELNLTLEKFGERLGVTKVAISNIEKGNRNLTDQMFKAICREFDVNEEWLRDGTGEMFCNHDETAALVYNLMMDSGDNEFYSSVLEVVRTYEQLKPESQQIIRDACKLLFKKSETQKPPKE